MQMPGNRWIQQSVPSEKPSRWEFLRDESDAEKVHRRHSEREHH